MRFLHLLCVSLGFESLNEYFKKMGNFNLITKEELTQMFIDIDAPVEIQAYFVELTKRYEASRKGLGVVNRIKEIEAEVQKSGRSFAFELLFDRDEIKFEVFIFEGWKQVFSKENHFTACDFETNFKNLEKCVSNLDYKRYI